MKRSSLFVAFTLLTALAVSGCKSGHGFESYISPEVKGRVLDARTQQPVEHVKVLLNPRNEHSYTGAYVSAGEWQETGQPIYSNDDGGFVMPSHKDLSFSGDNGWTSVTLKFLHEGYHIYTTNYLYSRAVTTKDGKPVVEAGDILLQALPVR